jgi:hypothetical protein
LINSTKEIINALVFLVPGYIIEEVVEAFVPTKQRNDSKLLLRWILYSFINYAIWYLWGLKLILKRLSPDSVFSGL